MPSDRTKLQVCLDELNAGDGSAWERLIPLVYQQLRTQAHAVFRYERNTLQATAVLHDALVDLLQQELSELQFEGPGRFFALVSRAIRNRLQDHVRRRRAAKRGGGTMIRIADVGSDDMPAGLREVDVVALHDVLDKLRAYDERLWEVTELKFFCGSTNQEAAEALGIALKTVESDWTFAKSWLQKQLGDAP